MRNGNKNSSIFLTSLYLFLSYLWGMETNFDIPIILSDKKFLSYLWGMETSKNLYVQHRHMLLRSYPTYEEWKQYEITLNGVYEYKSSYPTYEEWKPPLLLFPILLLQFVLILPMRNGNFLHLHILQFPILMFLSYLWGMETIHSYWTIVFIFSSSYPTYEEWKPS